MVEESSGKAIVIFGSNNPFLGMKSITDDTAAKLTDDLCESPINSHRFIPTTNPKLPGDGSKSKAKEAIKNYLKNNDVKDDSSGQDATEMPNGKGYIFACKYADVKKSEITLPQISDDDGNNIVVNTDPLVPPTKPPTT